MKSSKTWNNFSKEFLQKIPKLKPNQVVVFRMLNGVPNPDPDDKERSKDPILYPKVQLRTRFRVFDEHKEEYVDVVCADSWHGDEPSGIRCFVTGSNPSNPGAIMPSRFQGKFELKGGNVRDEELYEILYISPERKGTPCPDAAIEQIFEIQDVQSEAKGSLNKVAQLKKAMNAAEELANGKNGGLKKARAILASFNKPNYTDDELLKVKIQEFARDNYEDFNKANEDKNTDMRGVLAEALMNGVVKHDIATGELSVGNVKIADLKVDGVDNVVETLTQWVNTAENGKDVYANIQKQMKAVSK